MSTDGRLKSKDDIKVMQKTMYPFVSYCHTEEWAYQQNNAPIHISEVTCEWFFTENLSFPDWLIRSPDLNAIVNLQGAQVKKVYAGFKQFCNIETRLKAAD